MYKQYQFIGILIRPYWTTPSEDGYKRRKHKRFKNIAHQRMSTFYDIMNERLFHLVGIDRYSDPDTCHSYDGLFQYPFFVEYKYVTE